MSSKQFDSPVGWKTIENNHIYVKTTESSHGNPPAMNPNFVPEGGVPHTYVGNPVDMTLEVVVGEGLWAFIDLFGAPRQSTNPPVRTLTLDARETGSGGAPIIISPDVLNAFMAMLVTQNSQGMEVVEFNIQNVVLKDVVKSLGHAVQHMCNLKSVELFSNGLNDKGVEVKLRVLF